MAIKSFSKISPQADIHLPDDGKLMLGAGEDFQIYHQDSVPVNVITSNTADILFLQGLNDGNIKFSCDDGSGGVATYLQMDGGLGYSFVNRAIRFNDSVEAFFGTGSDLKILHNGSDGFISNIGDGDLHLSNFNDDGDVILRSDDGSGGITAYLTLDGGVGYTVAQKTIRVVDNQKIQLGSSGDLNILHDASDGWIINDTGDLYIRNSVDDKDIIFQSDNGSGGVKTYFFLDGSVSATVFPDSSKLYFGTGHDAYIDHDGTNTYFNNQTGSLIIRTSTDDADLILQSDDGSGGTTAYLTLDGSAGHSFASKNIRFLDSVSAVFGTGSDMYLYHDGSNSFIRNDTGNLTIFNNTDDGDIIFQSDDGSGGVANYIQIDGSEGRTLFSKHLRVNDDVELQVGGSNDLRLYHDGSNSQIFNYTGNLEIKNHSNDADIILQCDDGSGGITAYLTLDGSAGHTVANKEIHFLDNVLARFGSSNDFAITHNGTDTTFENNTGNMVFSNYADDKDIIFQSDDGSGGVEEYFRLDGSAGGANPVTKFPDSAKLQFGGGGDGNMNHDGSNFTFSVITGDLRVKCDTDDGNLKLQCDDGSGGAANYLVLDGGDKTLIAEVPLILEADSAVGWHGSVTRVKILPRDFQADNSGRPALTVLDTNAAHLASNASSNLFASIPIPTGFKATHVKIHGSDTGQTFTVKEANIANKTTVTKGTATALETEKAITNVSSSTTNYILIEVSSDGSTDEIHGGYMTIAKI